MEIVGRSETVRDLLAEQATGNSSSSEYLLLSVNSKEQRGYREIF